MLGEYGIYKSSILLLTSKSNKAMYHHWEILVKGRFN